VCSSDLEKEGPNSPLLALMRRTPRRDHEHEEQVALFAWAAENEANYPDLHWLFAVPNWIGVRTAKQGARLKSEGRKAGVLDVWLPVRRGPHPGLAIEMKVGKNRPTAEQTKWLNHLSSQGWSVWVAYSADEAKRDILGYLSAA
jgi:hypothetical protein